MNTLDKDIETDNLEGEDIDGNIMLKHILEK
jgi:hypothetical protein